MQKKHEKAPQDTARRSDGLCHEHCNSILFFNHIYNSNTMSYLIIDITENTGKPYIGENDQNCELIENAKIYETKEAADKQAKKYGLWAVVKEVD